MDTVNPKKHTYNKTILIVEDEAAMIDAMYDKLTMEGFYVIKAKDGREGLETAEREKPDLILLDVIMPTMDGISLLKELRNQADFNDVPIIVLSNLNPNDEVSYLITRSQPAYYLIKSETKLEHLLKKIKEVLHVT